MIVDPETKSEQLDQDKILTSDEIAWSFFFLFFLLSATIQNY